MQRSSLLFGRALQPIVDSVFAPKLQRAGVGTLPGDIQIRRDFGSSSRRAHTLERFGKGLVQLIIACCFTLRGRSDDDDNFTLRRCIGIAVSKLA